MPGRPNLMFSNRLIQATQGNVSSSRSTNRSALFNEASLSYIQHQQVNPFHASPSDMMVS